MEDFGSRPRSRRMTKETESRWRSLIAEQERSGMTLREFAGSRGITPTTLYWWRSRLVARRRPADLAPVEVVDHEVVVARRSPDDSAVEVEIDGSLRLRIRAGLDEAELRRLLRALRC